MGRLFCVFLCFRESINPWFHAHFCAKSFARIGLIATFAAWYCSLRAFSRLRAGWFERFSPDSGRLSYRNKTKRYALLLQVENLGNFHLCKESSESCNHGIQMKEDRHSSFTHQRGTDLYHLFHLGYPRAFYLKMEHAVPRFIMYNRSSWGLRRHAFLWKNLICYSSPKVIKTRS